ncbi:MAG: prephenate dehydratase [Thermoguttaceae bacterium]|nr:prephenate dehydratase [Thermoguttaceae bacterium]
MAKTSNNSKSSKNQKTVQAKTKGSKGKGNGANGKRAVVSPKPETVSQVKALQSSTSELSQLRSQLVEADKALLDALNKKIELERKYFELNCGQEKTVTDAKNPLALGSRYTDWNLDHQRIESMALCARRQSGGASENCVRAVFREALGDVRASVHPTRVAYLGPEFSFTHLAALKYFGTGVELIPVSSIAGIFEQAQSGECDFGVVPIENSTDGRIVDTLDMFTKTKIKISGESIIPICHCLIGNLPRSSIKTVYSKAQALSQCRNWLAKCLSGAELVACNSTTQAVELALAGADKGVAAIASMEAAKAYEVDVLVENIADNPDNRTRFVVLSKNSYDRKGNDKTSIMFQLRHVAGALADALNIFKRNHLNLTWIESFPVHGTDNEYLFFAEMEGHFKDLKIRRAIDALGKRSLRLEILGSYPAAK